tara:strand:- start:1485 stop:2267 length:783 start_codon:yes stop_codon:yes gene_type:complete
MNNIGIIGCGVVGGSIYNAFKRVINIVRYDKYNNLYENFDPILSTDAVFLAVPTPFNQDSNEIDLSALKESLHKLNSKCYKGIVIIKSTVPPLTMERLVAEYKHLTLCYNPEFLRERTASEDFISQKVVVISSDFMDGNTYKEIKDLYKRILDENAEYYWFSFREAEMLKISQNTILASRVAVANIVYDACEELGVNYDKIKQVGFDKFEVIGKHMTQVPGPDGNRGFGGKCLPKDIAGFNSIFKSEVIEEIINYNKTKI